VRRTRLRRRADVKAGGVREVAKELGEMLWEAGGGTKRSSRRRAAAMVEWSLTGRRRRLRRRMQRPHPALLSREREGWWPAERCAEEACERERGGAQRGEEARRENGWCGSVLHLCVAMKGRSRMGSADASSVGDRLGELQCKF
jgi:hypothetical protein